MATTAIYLFRNNTLFDLGIREAALDVILHAVTRHLLHRQLVAPLARLLLLEMVLSGMTHGHLTRSRHVETLDGGLPRLQLSPTATVGGLDGRVDRSRGHRHRGHADRVRIERRRAGRDVDALQW